MSFLRVYIVIMSMQLGLLLAFGNYQSNFAKNWRLVRDSNGIVVCTTTAVQPLDEQSTVDAVRCAGLCSIRRECNYFSYVSTASKCQLFTISQTTFDHIEDCKGYSLTKV